MVYLSKKKLESNQTELNVDGMMTMNVNVKRQFNISSVFYLAIGCLSSRHETKISCKKNLIAFQQENIQHWFVQYKGWDSFDIVSYWSVHELLVNRSVMSIGIIYWPKSKHWLCSRAFTFLGVKSIVF